MQINQYPNESFTFADNDYYDIDFWTGSGYETRKILGSVIKAGIAAAVATLYNSDGTLSGSRNVDLNGHQIQFLGAGNFDSFGISIDNTVNNSTFTQTLAQIYLSIYNNAISTGSLISLLNNSLTLTLEDNATVFTTFQLNFNEAYLEFNDGIVTRKLAATQNGIEINSSYILPTSDGLSGQFISTDGSGNLSFSDIPATVVSWGDIIGNLSDQTDLQNALDSKLNDPSGTASQYIRGDGSLADFPSPVGAGSSVSFYLNGGTSQGTILGGQYYQLSQNADLGANADFSLTADGLIAQFITDVAEPKRTLIPGGNWNMQFYFSASSGGGSPTFYVELHKYDGTAFTLLGSSSVSPEGITGGTSIDLYYTAVAIPETVLDVDDRLAVRVYIVHDGRTITLHTQANHLSEVITTFSTGIATLNGLTDQVQFFATGTSGTNFNITSSGDTHTFNIPTASGSNTGLLSSADWTTFNDKADDNIYTADGTLAGNRIVTMAGNTLSFNGGNLGVNIAPTVPLHIKGTAIPSVNEPLVRLEVADASGSYLSLDNASLVDGEFVPQMLGRQNSGSTQSALYMTGAIDTAQDSGTNPVVVFRSALSSLTQVVTRPIFAFKNWSTDVMNILANGNVGIGTTNPAEKLHVNGKTRTNTLQIITGAAANKFLSSDASGNGSWTSLPSKIQLAASDEISAITAGTGKLTFRMPYGMTLTGVRASLTTAQTSGLIFTVDILQSGVSILSTKLTIDNTERTSTTAATPAVISTSALTDDAEIRIDVTQIGDGTAKGLKITLLGTRS